MNSEQIKRLCEVDPEHFMDKGNCIPRFWWNKHGYSKAPNADDPIVDNPFGRCLWWMFQTIQKAYKDSYWSDPVQQATEAFITNSIVSLDEDLLIETYIDLKVAEKEMNNGYN